MLNSGSFKTVKHDDGNEQSILSREGAHGYYIRVYKNKIVFAGRDFYNDVWISDAPYVLDWKHDIGRPVENIEETKPATEKEETLTAEVTEEAPIVSENKGGCKSSLSGAAVVIMPASLLGFGVLRRRND